MTRQPSELQTDVVEMDAMAVDEWDRDRHTPIAPGANLAELVKQTASTAGEASGSAPSATMPPPMARLSTASPTEVQAGPLDETWADAGADSKAADVPKTSQNIVRRTSPMPAVSAGRDKPPSQPPIDAKHVDAKPVDAKPIEAKPVGAKTPPALTPRTITQSKARTPPTLTKKTFGGPSMEPARPSTFGGPSTLAKSKPSVKANTTPMPMNAVKPALPSLTAKPTPTASAASAAGAQGPVEPFAKTQPMSPLLQAAPMKSVAPPSQPDVTADTEVSDERREASVVVNLSAMPAPSEPDWSATTAASRPRAQSPVAFTSEHTTTASGAFLMPTAAAPMAAAASMAVAPAVPVAPAPMATAAAARATLAAAPTITAARIAATTRPQTDLAIPVAGDSGAVSSWDASVTNAEPIVAPPSPIDPPPWETVETAPMIPPGAVSLPPASEGWGLATAAPTNPPFQTATPGFTPGPLKATPDPAFDPALDDVASLRPRSPFAALLATQRSRRIALAAGGALGLLVVLGFALSGGESSTPSTSTDSVATATPTATTTRPAATPPTPTPPPIETPTTTKPAAAAPVAAIEPQHADEQERETPAIPTIPTTPPARKPRPHHATSRRPVVVDYDKQRADVPSDDSLSRARTSYTAGNGHLFAGETTAAIAAYHQALAAYPNYAAGYRGLGLAFSQQHDRPAALKAFRTYIGLAPTAKDVDLIKKRIAGLASP